MKTARWLGAALLLICLVASADVKETEQETFPVKPGARISLENINGDIRISGGGDGKVTMVAHKKAGDQEYLEAMKIVVDADEDHVRIETQHPKHEGGWFNWGGDSSGSVAYELSVPSDVSLDAIETVNGDITIGAVSGNVKAATVNGGLKVENLAGDVNLETVNGSISAVFDVLAGDQRVDAETVNGKIVLVLPADASARVTAETVNGSIDADDFGLEPEKGFVGRDLSGDIGSGSARISLDTVNGSIRLEKR
jgi:DUF4097 and DUF4098 domain-containing protein YvlB